MLLKKLLLTTILSLFLIPNIQANQMLDFPRTWPLEQDVKNKIQQIPTETTSVEIKFGYVIPMANTQRDRNGIPIIYLNAFKHLDGLKELAIYGAHRVKIDANTLLDSLNSSIENLTLQKIRLANDGSEFISSFINKKDSKVTKLDLRNNGIGPEGLASIFEALHTNKTITDLNLQYNPLYIIQDNNYSNYPNYIISDLIIQHQPSPKVLIESMQHKLANLQQMANDCTVSLEKFFNLLSKNDKIKNLTLSLNLLAPSNLESIEAQNLAVETISLLTKEILLTKKDEETLTLIKQVCNDICEKINGRQTPMTINLHIGMDFIRLLTKNPHGCRMELPDVLNVTLYKQPYFKLEVSPIPENDTTKDNPVSEGILDYIIITYKSP